MDQSLYERMNFSEKDAYDSIHLFKTRLEAEFKKIIEKSGEDSPLAQKVLHKIGEAEYSLEKQEEYAKFKYSHKTPEYHHQPLAR